MSFQSFSSTTEMLDSMEADRLVADSKIKDWQKELAPGDFFVRTAKVFGQSVNIYGKVLDPTLPHYQGQKTDVLEELGKVYQEDHMLGYRLCRCYSIHCDTGEIGDVHVSTVGVKITKDEFEYAKKKDWR